MVKINFQQGANELEKCVLQGAVGAQKEYKETTGGWWLWHGPESFLQVVVAQKIAKKTGHFVYIDASRSRIERERGRGPGRPAASGSQRADISVWNKTGFTLRAVIEIKRSIGTKPILDDVHRMNTWMGLNNPPAAAYMLAYSEARGKNRMKTLEKRFTTWTEQTCWIDKGKVVYDDPDDPDYAWGIILMRHQ
jgi:hypothetical protein